MKGLFMIFTTTVASAFVNGQPLHSGLNYSRYLQQRNETKAELMDYFGSDAFEAAESKGIFTRKVEERGAEPTEDELRRFHLAKEVVQELSKKYPNTEFSVDSPFTMLTEEEFEKYVQMSMKKGDNGRMLRRMANQSPHQDDGKKGKRCKSKTPAPSPASPTPTPTSIPSAEPPTDSPTPARTGINWQEKGCLTPVKSQGQCGSCWAFATIAGLESAKCIQDGKLISLSDQQITSCDSSNGGCNGGTAFNALEFIQSKKSVCTETSFPYVGEATCRQDCEHVPIEINKIHPLDSSEDSLVKALQKQPVIVTVAAGNHAWKQYKSGVLPSCDTTAQDHAVLIYGYTEDAWLIKNSWGNSWGEDGMIRLQRGTGGKGTCGILSYMVYREAVHHLSQHHLAQ